MSIGGNCVCVWAIGEDWEHKDTELFRGQHALLPTPFAFILF